MLLTVLSVGSGWRSSPASRILCDAPQQICGRWPDAVSISSGSMTNRRANGRLAILGFLLFCSGCVTTRRHPVVPLPVRLVSRTPFFAHVRARADTAATSCQVLRISGTVTEVRGDTLEFSAVSTERRPRGAADCLEGRAGFVVLSGAPALQAETTILRKGRTVLLVAFLVPISAIVVVFGMIGMIEP